MCLFIDIVYFSFFLSSGLFFIILYHLYWMLYFSLMSCSIPDYCIDFGYNSSPRSIWRSLLPNIGMKTEVLVQGADVLPRNSI